MELINELSVGLPVDHTWRVITDLERIAPCLPGATLVGVDGDDYLGKVKIKVGPVTASYEGSAHFVTRDDDQHHAVIEATGRDTRGQGNARATIDLRLHAHGDGTRVDIVTDLDLAGRVAQFGRGVIADVSSKLIGQFAARLEQEVLAPAAPESPGSAVQPSAGSAPQAGSSAVEAEPLDLLAIAGGSQNLLRTAGVAGVGAIVLLLLAALLRRPRAGAAPAPPQQPLVLLIGLAAERLTTSRPADPPARPISRSGDG